MNVYYPTGCCDTCGYRYRLRKDGTMGLHYRWTGRSGEECPGTGNLPR
jgi:hypothetical protein